MNTYKRHRFPPDVISYAVWLYHRFNLSNREVEDLLAERGISVSYLYGVGHPAPLAVLEVDDTDSAIVMGGHVGPEGLVPS